MGDGVTMNQKIHFYKFSFFFFIALITGCVHATSVDSLQEKISVGNTEILLNNKTCKITVNGQVSKIKMEPTCYFAKKSNQNEATVEYFEDIDSHVVVVVEKTGVKSSKFSYSLERDDCSYKSRALIIKDGVITISSGVFDGFSCAGKGLDQKDYWILSH